MGKTNDSSSNQPKEAAVIFLTDLHKDSTGPIVVMMCRRWDVISVKNKYMSTDYIVSDEKGNAMHCFVRSAIAYRFKPILEEGCLYMLKDFTVLPTPEKYRIMKDAEFMIEIQGSTIVRKATYDVDKFIRHPFELVSFEQLIPSDNKYFVDVVGYVTAVGPASRKSTGSQTVEFNLTNERGQQVRVTLWGGLGDTMIVKKRMHPGVYVILLTCMSSKEYLGNLCLSSSSSTMLIDDENIPAIKAFKGAISGVEVVDTGVPLLQVRATISTLQELLEWGRTKSKKEAGAYQGAVEITNVRTRKGWFNYTCTSGKCRKGVEPNPSSVFFCESCNKEVKFPRPRYRLQLDITDGTADSVVVLFDETAEKLIGRPVRAVITEAEQDETGDSFVLPQVLRDLIGTRHVFEIRTHTYFHAGDYESFNCSQIVHPVPDVLEQQNNVGQQSQPTVQFDASSSNNALKTKSPKALENSLIMSMPSKKNESSPLKIFENVPDTDLAVEEKVETSGGHGKKRTIDDSDPKSGNKEDGKGKKQA